MAVDKRELTLDLLARDKTKAATDSAAKNLDNVADSADDASKSALTLSKVMGGTSDEADKLGKAASENARDIAKLDREIGLAEKELESLARAFARTDDAAERLDLSKAARKLESDIKKLGKNKGLLERILPDPEPAARGFMTKLGAGIAEGGAGIAAKAGGSVGPVVGGAIAAAAAPVLISALGSALSAGAGAGVLGAGIMLAVKGDKDIQAAGAEMGRDFIAGLQASAVENFAGPVKQSLGIIEAAGTRVVRKWDEAFSELSGSVVPLTRDIVTAGERINTSLAGAAKDSGPALKGLGGSINLLADGVGDFIDTVVDGGPSAAANLQLIAGATADLARFTGNNLKVMSDMANSPWVQGPLLTTLKLRYQGAADSAELLGAVQTTVESSMDLISGRAEEMKKTVAEAAMSFDELADSMDKVVDVQQELYGSEVDVREAVIDATKAIQANGETIDLNTEKGRKNRTALLDLAEALGKDNAAYRGVNGVSEKTTAHMESNRTAFVKAARAAGYNAGEAKKLADRLLGIPIKTEPRVSMKGAGKAIGDARTLNRLVRDFQGVYTATMITNYVRHGKPGTGGGLATGGLVDGPGTSTSDSVPMMLSKGEYVVRAAQVARPGVQQMLENLNSGGGGALQGAEPAGGRSGGSRTQTPTAMVSRLELVGDREVVSFVRRLIRTHNLLQDR